MGLEVFKKSQLATRAHAIVEDRWDRRQCDGRLYVDQTGGTLGDSAQAVSGSVTLGQQRGTIKWLCGIANLNVARQADPMTLFWEKLLESWNEDDLSGL